MASVASALAMISIAGTALAVPAADVPPSPAPGTIGAAYSIAFWGVPFGATDYQGKFSDGNYAASSHFETSGIVSLFWQAAIDASAAGHIGAQSVQPAQYDSYYRRGSSKKERVQVTFENGAVKTFANPPYDTAKYPVSDAEKRDAVDPMSAITLVLTGLGADRTSPCGKVAPVFDGRRRYDIEFTYVKDEPVTLGGGVFSGNAHLCQLHYRQIAGFKPKILKEGAAFPPIFGDFGDIPAAGAPRGRYVVALKLWSHLDGGTVSAQLTRLRTSAPSPRN
jgi:hypothetical protein